MSKDLHNIGFMTESWNVSRRLKEEVSDEFELEAPEELRQEGGVNVYLTPFEANMLYNMLEAKSGMYDPDSDDPGDKAFFVMLKKIEQGA